jgi:hypothetical protein
VRDAVVHERDRPFLADVVGGVACFAQPVPPYGALYVAGLIVDVCVIHCMAHLLIAFDVAF